MRTRSRVEKGILPLIGVRTRIERRRPIAPRPVRAAVAAEKAFAVVTIFAFAAAARELPLAAANLAFTALAVGLARAAAKLVFFAAFGFAIITAEFSFATTRRPARKQ
jgi:hypothetical protein